MPKVRRQASNNGESRESRSESVPSRNIRKRARPLFSTSDEEENATANHSENKSTQSKDRRTQSKSENSTGARPKDCTVCRSEMTNLKQKIRKAKTEKRDLDKQLADVKVVAKGMREKIVSKDRIIDKLKKEKANLKKGNDTAAKQKEELEKLNKKIKKKLTTCQNKVAELEKDRSKLESRVSALVLNEKAGAACSSSSKEPAPGPSSQAGCSGGATGGASGGGSLFQDMLDNFKELAENQLQCPVCSELITDAVSINCGHTFCYFCIEEWRKKKNNCPVCRTNITASVPTKILNEYLNNLVDQFFPEEAKHQRKTLVEEREKQRKEHEEANRAVGRNRVNIVLNRRRDEEREEENVESDNTIELYLMGNRGSGSDNSSDSSDDSSDDEGNASILIRSRRSLRSVLDEIDSESSNDSDFRLPGVIDSSASDQDSSRQGSDNDNDDDDDSSSSSSSSSESSDEEDPEDSHLSVSSNDDEW